MTSTILKHFITLRQSPRRLSVLLLLGVATSVATASADEDTALIDDISIYATFSYDQVTLIGVSTLCAAAESGSRQYGRLDKSDAGHDDMVRLLIAAKLAGKEVELATESRGSPGRCYVVRVTVE